MDQSIKHPGLTLVLAILILITVSCNHKQKSPPPPLTPKEQAQQDLADLNNIDLVSIGYYQQGSHVIEKVFGGTTGSDVKDYVDKRLHYYFSQEEFNAATFTPSDVYDSSEMSDSGEKNMTMLGLNMGVILWLRGLDRGVTVNIRSAGQEIDVQSPRTGIMILGEGYAQAMQLQGKTPVSPQLFRQSILVHEARHSDCASKSTAGYSTKCGFLHVKCTRGELVGIVACDDQPWGAYAIDAIFLDGTMNSLPSDSAEYALLEYFYGDSVSRLEYSYSQLLGGDLGEPDMSGIEDGE